MEDEDKCEKLDESEELKLRKLVTDILAYLTPINIDIINKNLHDEPFIFLFFFTKPKISDLQEQLLNYLQPFWWNGKTRAKEQIIETIAELRANKFHIPNKNLILKMQKLECGFTGKLLKKEPQKKLSKTLFHLDEPSKFRQSLADLYALFDTKKRKLFILKSDFPRFFDDLETYFNHNIFPMYDADQIMERQIHLIVKHKNFDFIENEQIKKAFHKVHDNSSFTFHDIILTDF